MTQITDALVLDDKLTIDESGYLVVNARTARTGIQQYLGSEIGRSDLEVVNVLRDESEVFAKNSLQTFSHIPITNDHPPESVTADNWKKFAVGTTGDEVLRDGEYLKIGLKITDKDTVSDVQSGKRQLSVGYTTELEWRDGAMPDGTPYQAIQRNIVANHVAVVRRGRAGSQVRIGDEDGHHWGAAPLSITPSKDHEAIMPDNTRTVVVDGLSVVTTDHGATAIDKLLKERDQARGEITDLTKSLADNSTAFDKKLSDAIAAKDEEIGGLKVEIKQLKDSAPKPEDLDKMVADRAAVVTVAQKLVKDFKPDGLTNDAIRRAVVAKTMGEDAVRDVSDAEISGMYRVISKDAETRDPVADAIRGNPRIHTPVDDEEKAYLKSVADLNRRPNEEAA